MILHRRDRHFLRQLQVALVEMPEQRHRPFDQRRDFIEQRVFDDCVAAARLRERQRSAADQLAPLGDVCDDVSLLQRLDIFRRARDRQRSRRVKAMPA